MLSSGEAIAGVVSRREVGIITWDEGLKIPEEKFLSSPFALGPWRSHEGTRGSLNPGGPLRLRSTTSGSDSLIFSSPASSSFF